jgi:uncharacterized protein (TIGR02996 family)
MDERAALLRAVCDAPDDTPRLVFADWLDEHGEPERAEFIRLQLGFNGRLGRLPAGDRSGERRLARLLDLLGRYKRRWLAELPAVDGRWQPYFARGFVGRLELAELEPLLADPDALFYATPVTHLQIGYGCAATYGRVLSRLLDHVPPARRLRYLDIGITRVDRAGLTDELEYLATSGVAERTSVCLRVEALNTLGIPPSVFAHLANRFERHGRQFEVLDFDFG